MKKILSVLLAVLFLLSGCAGNVKSAIPVKKGDLSSLKSLGKSSYFEFYSDSPDGKNAILEKFDLEKLDEDRLTRTTQLYLNDTSKPLQEYNYHVKGTESFRSVDVAQWIDDERLLLKGESIYNIKTGAKEYIDFHDLMEKGSWLTNYALSPDKKSIAYLTFSRAVLGDNGVYHITETIYNYFIDTKEYQFLYQNTFEIDVSEPMTAEQSYIFWDEDQNIVFTEWAHSLKPYTLKVVDVATEDVTSKAFPEKILSDYENGKYLLTEDEQGVVSVLEFKTGKKLYSSENMILAAISGDKLFLYEGDSTIENMKPVTKNGVIRVVSLPAGETLQEILLDTYETLDCYFATVRNGVVTFNINHNILQMTL